MQPTALVLHDPATYTHGFPYDEFRDLRRDAPVSHHDHPVWERGYWAVVRHADVVRVSRDSSTFRNSPHPMVEVADDDDVRGARGDADQQGSARAHAIAQAHQCRLHAPPGRGSHRRDPRTRRRLLVDAVSGQTSCDLVTDMALWLPLHVIADLVGVPEEDRAHVFELTELTFGFDASVTREQRGEAAMEMYAYADQLCEQRRREPRDDLLSVLLDAEVDGERLTQLQIDIFFLMLQNAGSETTRNLITTGALALLEHPDQMRRGSATTCRCSRSRSRSSCATSRP